MHTPQVCITSRWHSSNHLHYSWYINNDRATCMRIQIQIWHWVAWDIKQLSCLHLWWWQHLKHVCNQDNESYVKIAICNGTCLSTCRTANHYSLWETFTKVHLDLNVRLWSGNLLCFYLLPQVELSRPLSGDHFEVNLHRGYRTNYYRGTRFTAELGITPDSDRQYQLAIKVGQLIDITIIFIQQVTISLVALGAGWHYGRLWESLLVHILLSPYLDFPVLYFVYRACRWKIRTGLGLTIRAQYTTRGGLIWGFM